MSWKKKWLKSCRLYVVLNRSFFKNNLDLIRCARKIALCGVKIIQLRDKESDKKIVLETALILKKQLKQVNCIFIVNDHADIAMLADADGLHLGQTDLPLPAARKLLGKNKIIGFSCQSLKQALFAEEQGADYLGVGAVFPTSTKPERVPLDQELVKKISQKVKIPVFAIGGINETNVLKAFSLGVSGVAVSSAICAASDAALSTRSFLNKLNS